MNWRRLGSSMGSPSEPAVPAYSSLRCPGSGPQVLGVGLNRSESLEASDDGTGHYHEQLFIHFALTTAVPEDHPVRKIAAVLDLSWVHSEVVPFYRKMGRPSIDPELMIRMLAAPSTVPRIPARATNGPVAFYRTPLANLGRSK